MATKDSMSRLALVIVAALLRVASPAAAQSEVNLSRYQLSLTVLPEPFPHSVFLAVDHDVLLAFCADKDGCTARVRVDTPLGVRGEESLVYLGFGFTAPWSTDLDAALHYDGDGNAERAVDVSNGLANCYLSDGETESTDSDGAIGFSFVATNSDTVNGFDCALVLID